MERVLLSAGLFFAPEQQTVLELCLRGRSRGLWAVSFLPHLPIPAVLSRAMVRTDVRGGERVTAKL